MTTTAGWYTPMLRVAEIERSIPFYEVLGFELIDTDRCEPIGWARMHCQGGAVMLLRGGPTNPMAQTVMFYMYTPDLPALREQLVEKGVRYRPSSIPTTARAVKCISRIRTDISSGSCTGATRSTPSG